MTISTDPLTNSNALLDRALSYALRLIIKMEASVPHRDLIYVPDVVVWAMESLNPTLVQALREAASFGVFRDCLEAYGKARPKAVEISTQADFDACAEAGIDWPDDGSVTADDMLDAMNSGSLRGEDKGERAKLKRALLAVRDRRPRASSLKSMRELPPVVHSYSIADELGADAYAADGHEANSILWSAMQHARNELITCDDGADDEFWQKTYPEVVTRWLELDLPETAADIIRAGAVVEYVVELQRFLSLMQDVERVWSGVSFPVRALLVRCKEKDIAVRIVQSIVRADNTDESNVPCYASLVWNMIRRREAQSRARMTIVNERTETNDYIDDIRATSSSYETCFVADTARLPSDIRAVIQEKDALVVRLPESWLNNKELLAENIELRPFFSKHTVSKEKRCELAMSNAFWCDYDELWPVLFAFRRTIPVVYVFEKLCVVCQYPFQHFTDLRYVTDISPKHYPTTCIDEDGTFSEYGDNGWTRVQPSLIKGVVDEGRFRAVGALSRIFLSEQPDASQSSEGTEAQQ